MFFLSDTMKFFIVFVLAFATVLAKDLYSHSIGVPVIENEGRIANGKNAYSGQFPYQVGINFKKGIKFLWCGGSLIGDTWVLTSAFCINGSISAEVYLGATERLLPAIIYTIFKKDMIMHPKYHPKLILNDIGLIRTSKTPMTEEIGIVKIPNNDNEKYLGDTVVIAGWGQTNDISETLSKDLKYATLKVTAGHQCLNTFPNNYDVDTNMCVATPNLVSACPYDNGGPLVLNKPKIQVGVFSYSAEKGCEHGIPIVFVRVSAYLPWIRSTTKIRS